MKLLSRTILPIYLFVLLWLVLFKLSSDPLSVLSDYQTRSLNLIPFAGTRSHINETIYNFVVFVPLGLILNVNLKMTNFWRKLAYICAFSLAVEMLQYVFAIGRTDITDVITNTLGGLVGLLLYSACGKYIESEKLDRFIVVTGTIVIVLFVLLRTLVFKVRYQ